MAWEASMTRLLSARAAICGVSPPNGIADRRPRPKPFREKSCAEGNNPHEPFLESVSRITRWRDRYCGAQRTDVCRHGEARSPCERTANQNGGHVRIHARFVRIFETRRGAKREGHESAHGIRCTARIREWIRRRGIPWNGPSEHPPATVFLGRPFARWCDAS